MGRAIVTQADLRGFRYESAPKADGYADRLVKYIPAEVVAAYLGVEAALAKVPLGQQLVTAIVVFALFFLGNIPWLRKLGVRRPLQLVVSMLSFAVWVFGTSGGPLAYVEGGKALVAAYGPIVVCVFTFLAGLIEPSAKDQGSTATPPAPGPA